MAKLMTLEDGLLEQLKDLYSAENQLVKALPKMEKKASNKKLKQAFASHLKETKNQVARLEKISKLMGKKLTGKTCKAMKGLIEEGSEIIKEDSENDGLLDTLLISAAQKVEHYEIASYGTARTVAEKLGEKEIAKLLDETLQEEGAADKKLTAISEDQVLDEAEEMGGQEDDEDEKRVANY